MTTPWIDEHYKSRKGGRGMNAYADLIYSMGGTENGATIHNLLDATAPSTYDSKIRQYTEVEPLGWGGNTGTGMSSADMLWKGTAHYGLIQPPDFSVPSFSFDTTGATVKATLSLKTKMRKADVGNARDFHGLINVSEAGVPEGTDVHVPFYQFSETWYFAESVVDAVFKKTLYLLTARTNAAAFKGFDPGEVLFLGARGSHKRFDLWEISYLFVAQPNLVNFNVGAEMFATGIAAGTGIITGLSKGGWDLLWQTYQWWTDPSTQLAVKVPKEVFIEQLYREGDFAMLGIGTT